MTCNRFLTLREHVKRQKASECVRAVEESPARSSEASASPSAHTLHHRKGYISNRASHLLLISIVLASMLFLFSFFPSPPPFFLARIFTKRSSLSHSAPPPPPPQHILALFISSIIAHILARTKTEEQLASPLFSLFHSQCPEAAANERMKNSPIFFFQLLNYF